MNNTNVRKQQLPQQCCPQQVDGNNKKADTLIKPERKQFNYNEPKRNTK